MLAEISSLKRARNNLEKLSSNTSNLDGERIGIDELRAQLKSLEPLRLQLETKYTEIDEKLKTMKELGNENYSKLKELNDQRKILEDAIGAEFSKRRELSSTFKEQKDAWYHGMVADRERRYQAQKTRREAEQQERLEDELTQERELAEVPAYFDEINTCTNMVLYLKTLDNIKPDTTAAVKEPKPALAANVRAVDKDLTNGGVALKRKEDREDAYMVMGGGKKKGKKSTKSATLALRFDLQTLSSFATLGVPVPTKVEEIQATIDKVEEKKQFYLVNQAKATQANKIKAEEKIKALLEKRQRVLTEGSKDAVTVEPEVEQKK